MAIFRPTTSKLGVQKVFLCPFHYKTRPSGVSIESPRLENILQVPGNGDKVDENYDARNGLLAILSVLNIALLHFKTERVAETALRAS